jgi:hypothetical protein
MTTEPAPQCLVCARWVSPLDQGDDIATQAEPTQVCAAFPLADGGIPDEIWHNQADHRRPYPGDHGLQWTAQDGEQFPEWALVTKGGTT